jgi:hypothetical protein
MCMYTDVYTHTHIYIGVRILQISITYIHTYTHILGIVVYLFIHTTIHMSRSHKAI